MDKLKRAFSTGSLDLRNKMWIERTEEERIEVKKKKHGDRIKMSLFYFLLFTIGGTFLSRPHFFTPAEEIPSKFPWAFMFGIVGGLGYYFFKRKTPSVFMCLDCETQPEYENQENCKCGGKFVDLEYYKWKEV